MKSLGQIAYEAYWNTTQPGYAWSSMLSTTRGHWERTAEAVVAEYNARLLEMLEAPPVERRRRSERTDPVYA